MIYAITGKPGAGKSYFLVNLAKKFLEKGVNVYSNIKIDIDNLVRPRKTIFGKIIVPGTCYYWNSLADFRYIENGIVLLDEASAYFEAREWSKFSVEDRVKFQQHRKMQLTIYLTVQNFSRIDSSIRQLCAYAIEVNHIGKLYYMKKFEPEEIHLAKRKNLGLTFMWFNKKTADCYDTNEFINLRYSSEFKFKKMTEIISENRKGVIK